MRRIPTIRSGLLLVSGFSILFFLFWSQIIGFELQVADRGIFDVCPSFEYRYDDPAILMELGHTPRHKECHEIELLTILENGKLRINEKFPDYEKYICGARCAWFLHNYRNRYGDWCTINEHHNCIFPCDVIEVKCMLEGRKEYVFAHTQIYPYSRNRSDVFGSLYKKTLTPAIEKENYFPDVHILLLDSMGLNPVLRQMPETVEFLENQLDAVIFKQYTRTGENSRYNMLAGFFGEIPTAIDRRLYGGGILEPSLDKDLCSDPLDDRNYVQFDYEDAGYKTMYAQDNYLVTFGYLECVGIQNQLATHYMRPHQILGMLEDDMWSKRPVRNHTFVNDYLLKRYLRNASNCQELHTQVLDYMGKFLDSYPGKSKMSITWSSLAHNGEQSIKRADHTIRKFLEKHQDTLDNSFFILMGDHGQRFDTIQKSAQGMYESNNPAMFFSLPRKLRNTTLHEVAKRNSRELLSHHDLYATLIDIVRHQPSANFNDTEFREIQNSHGNSWIRSLDPNLSRGCRNLPISSQYCTCNYGDSIVSRTSPMWRRIYDVLALDMNRNLEAAGLADLCDKIAVMRLSEVHKMGSTGKSSYYRAMFETTSGGVFVVQYEFTAKEELIPYPAEWKRVNAYGTAADCLHSRHLAYKPLCFCKDQAKGNK
ncbi:unnamed protein product, partial [Mesorhabditis spiculigera]